MTDGQQAVDAVLAQHVNYFSMVILDIGMPNKGGVEACREIKEYYESGVAQKYNSPNSTHLQLL